MVGALLRAILICAALLVAGCQTGELFLSGPIGGHVIDARTHAPIEDVLITVRSPESKTAQVTGRTDKNGKFALSALKGRMNLLVPYGDPIARPAVARFEAAGYETQEFVIQGDDPKFLDREPIELTPNSAE